MTFFLTKILLWNFPNIHKNRETRATSPQLTTLSFDSSQFLPVFYDLCPFLGECCYALHGSPPHQNTPKA